MPSPQQQELGRRVAEILRGVPDRYIVDPTGPLSWNLRSTERMTYDIDLGWDLRLDLSAARFELTHSNDFRLGPMFGQDFVEVHTDKIPAPGSVEPSVEDTLPERLTASYLPLSALEREGAVLAFIMRVLTTYPPNTDCAT